MDVSLTPELARFVEERVAAGEFQTADDVVQEALRLLQEQLGAPERLEALRAVIDEGIASLERGEGIPGDRAFEFLFARHGAARDTA